MFHQYKFGEVKTAHIDINSGRCSTKYAVYNFDLVRNLENTGFFIIRIFHRTMQNTRVIQAVVYD